jgi:hypothetical protein
MNRPSTDPAERFAALVAAVRGAAGVSGGAVEPGARRRFGASALKVNGKIFAMLVDDRLVVKLPRQRVDEMTAAGEGTRFVGARGRAMREWLALDPASERDWAPLVDEALAFVAGQQ